MPIHIQKAVGDLRTPRAPQMTPDKMRGLAARLRARAKNVLLRKPPEQHRDLATAAGRGGDGVHRDLVTAADLIDQLVELRVVIRSAEAVAHRLHGLFSLAAGGA
jgi:hypothetical protein